ncbi:MAG: acyl-CoA thioester hydrolase [Ruminococcus sp.]|nr:acyl-CoA thioester hydrolase [Ruminococcus sp.]
MKHRNFSVENDGFYGAYWKNSTETNAGIIAMVGDDIEDHMAKSFVKWFHRLGLNVMTMSPAKKDYSHHNYPLERIETAMKWLMEQGNLKVGIIGASTTAMVSLAAASRFPDITLTIALSPSDFIWQGFERGNLDDCKEWPVEGESTVSFRGKPLPYMPFAHRHPDYWYSIVEKARVHGDMTYSRHLFDVPEQRGWLKEEHMIEIEKIRGRLVLVGADDDVLWDTVRYIQRMEQRLKKLEHYCSYAAYTYEHGTHFVFPQSALQIMLPVGADRFVNMAFSDAKNFPEECKKTRIDIDEKLKAEIANWKDGKLNK